MSDFEVRLTCSCEAAARLTSDSLARHGFKVVRTFDLRDAMRVQGTPCLCPHHGSEACAWIADAEAVHPNDRTASAPDYGTRIVVFVPYPR